MTIERVQKIIAQAGICSRRKAEELILAGRVRINGRIVTELGVKADTEKDKIEVDDKQLQNQKLVYYLLNKPAGTITSAKDEADRPVVFDLVPEKRRLVSAGRLDYNTEGALLLTNDGELVHKLTHPSSRVPKEYEVKVREGLSASQIRVIENGVLLDDGPAEPVSVEKIKATERHAWYHLILHEGRNREVRRIIEAVGGQVIRLRRLSFAGLSIASLPVGEHRPLSIGEILSLYEQAGMVFLDEPKEKKEPRPAPKAESTDRTDRKPASKTRKAPNSGNKPTGKPRRTEDRPVPKGERKPTGKPRRTEDRPVPKGERKPTGKPRRTEDRPAPKGERKPTGKPRRTEDRPAPKGERKPTGKPRRTEDRPAPKGERKPTGKPRRTEDRPAPKGERKPTGKPRRTEDRPAPKGERKPTGKPHRTEDRPAPKGEKKPARPGKSPTHNDKRRIGRKKA